MYLYSRTGHAAHGKELDATAFALEISAKVNSITSLDVRAWVPVYGVPLNTITWVAIVEHAADMAATGDKLLADASYLDMLSTAPELFEGPIEDSIAEIITMYGDHSGDPTFASVVNAQCAAGRIADAMAWGVDIGTHVHSITGRDGAFGRPMYGQFGQVTWISLADTAEQIEAADSAMVDDPGYLERVDQAGDLFVEGSATSLLSRRIA